MEKTIGNRMIFLLIIDYSWLILDTYVNSKVPVNYPVILRTLVSRQWLL